MAPGRPVRLQETGTCRPRGLAVAVSRRGGSTVVRLAPDSESALRRRLERNKLMYIGIGTIVLIVIIVLVVLMLRRR